MELLTRQTLPELKSFLESHLPLTVPALSLLEGNPADSILGGARLFRAKSGIVGYSHLGEDGSVYYHAAKPEICHEAASALLEMSRPIRRMYSDYSNAVRLWDLLFPKDAPEPFRKRELHYILELAEGTKMPEGTRLLRESDFAEWHPFFTGLLESWGAPRSWINQPMEADFKKSVVEKRVVGAFENGKLCSTASLSQIYRTYARVGRVFTLPNERKKGFAVKTMNALARVGFERGLSHLNLYTNEHNTPAQRLYASLGYRPIGDVGIIGLR